MKKQTMTRLCLILMLLGTWLWLAPNVKLTAQATPLQQTVGEAPMRFQVQPDPDDFFAPSPAANALPPAELSATAAAIQLASAAAPWMLPDPVWRIGVTRDGLYALSYAYLETAGVAVVGTGISSFQIWHRGIEVAIEVNDANGNGIFNTEDSLIFYGERFHGSTQDEKYTDENVYWLTVDPAATGKRMSSRSVSPSGAHATGYCEATVVAEQNLRYFARWNANPGTQTTWFWERMIAPLGQVVTYTFPMPLANIHATPYTASLLIELAGRSYSTSVNPDHHLRLALNGTPIGETFWDGEVGHIAVLNIPSALLQEGENALQLGVVGTTIAQDVYFDRAELTSMREPVAIENTVACTVPETGTHTYRFTNLPFDARLYDITDALNPVKLTGHNTFLFTDTAAAGTQYIAATPASVTPPTAVYLPLVLRNSGNEQQLAVLTSPQAVATNTTLPVLAISEYHPDTSLITPTTGADLLIVAPREFHTALQPLIQRRQSQGLRVALAAEQDIYPLFNGGIYHPEAIRAFVAHAYATWPAPAPQYVLLVGGGHFNFKGYAPETFGEPTRIWIPPYLEFADPDQGEVPVDARYGDVNGDGFPELMVGRIPANSEAELVTYLNKLLAYDILPTANWMETVLLVADDGGVDYAEPYYAAGLEAIRTDFFPQWTVSTQVYIQNYCPKDPANWQNAPCPAATEALTQTWSLGAALLLYAGHGAPGAWAHEPLIRGSQLATLEPVTGQPFVIALDCWDGFWMYPRTSNVPGVREAISIGERATMGWGDRGAIALFGPAGLGYMSIEEQMARAMAQEAFAYGERGLGELTQAGRQAIWNLNSGKYLARTYTLLGDPSMQLRLENVAQVFD